MKNNRVIQFLIMLAVACAVALVHGPLAALVCAGLIAVVFAAPSRAVCVTLTVDEILQLTMDAFKSSLPMLPRFTTDFSSATARKDDDIIAHIASVPTVRDYDATTGYKANAANSEDLITDVTVKLDRLRHVPIKIDYLTQLASRKDLFQVAIKEYGYALAKDVVDYSLSLVDDTNVTHEKVESIANTTLETIESIRGSMNTQKAPRSGRIGIINTEFAGALQNDDRIASGDYYGQLNGTDGYRHFVNLGGFSDVWEYPDFPTNSINLSGFFCHPSGVVIASRVPSIHEAAQRIGIPSVAKMDTLTDPNTGLTFLGIGWQEVGTFDYYVTVALLYGAKVGTQGGAADAAVDKSCFKVVTA